MSSNNEAHPLQTSHSPVRHYIFSLLSDLESSLSLDFIAVRFICLRLSDCLCITFVELLFRTGLRRVWRLVRALLIAILGISIVQHKVHQLRILTVDMW